MTCWRRGRAVSQVVQALDFSEPTHGRVHAQYGGVHSA